MSQKLYAALTSAGSYTKSYKDFESQFSTREKQNALYETLVASGTYTKSEDEFVKQFFPPKVVKPAPNKVSSQSNPEVTSSGQPQVDLSQITDPKQRAYHERMMKNPNAVYNPNTGGYTFIKKGQKKEDVVHQTQQEVNANIEQSKKVKQEQEDQNMLKSAHITFDQMSKGEGLFDDKEKIYKQNLEKFYEKEGITVNIIDEWGSDDQIELVDANGRKLQIRSSLLKKRPDMIMNRISNWVQTSRKDIVESRGKKVEKINPEDLVIPGFENQIDKDIKNLEEIIENSTGPTKEKLKAEQELSVLKEQKLDNEFDQNYRKQDELLEKYNSEVSEVAKNYESYLKQNQPDLTEEQIAEQVDKRVNSYINGNFSLPERRIIEENVGGIKYGSRTTRGTKEIRDAAIANLKKSIADGYGSGQFKDADVDLEKYIGDDEWKLLDGLSMEEIEALAGLTVRGDKAVEVDGSIWNDEKKQAHINKIKTKLFNQENRDAVKQSRLLEQEFEGLEVTSTNLEKEAQSLQSRTEVFNARMNPVIEQLETQQAQKTNLEAELQSLYNEIDQSAQPTTQEEVNEYNNKIKKYEGLLSKYNGLTENIQNTYSTYEELMKEGDALKQESENFNSRLEQHKGQVKDFTKRSDIVQTQVDATKAKYGIEIVDGFMKFKNDYVNIDRYEEWRKRHKIEYSIFDKDAWALFGQGLGQTALKWATGTPLLANQALSAAFGDFADDPNQYDRLDFLEDMYEKYTNYDLVGVARDEDYNPGDMSVLDKGTRAIAQGLPFMLAIAASGGKEIIKNPGAMFSGPLGKKLIENLPLAVTGFNLTAQDNVIEGKRMGLSDNQALAYGTIVGSTIGMSQMIMPDSNFLTGAGSASAKNALKEALKNITTKAGMKYVAKNWAGNVLKEVLEEEVEFALESLTQGAFGLEHAKGFTDWKNHSRLIHDTIWLSGGMGAVGAKRDYKNFRNAAMLKLKGNTEPVLKQLNTSIREIEKRIEKAGQENDTDAMQEYDKQLKQLLNAKNYINNFKAALNVAPELVTEDELELLVEKMRLEQLKANQDPSFHKAIDKQLDDINAKIEDSAVQRNQKEIYKRTVENVKNMINGTTDSQGKTRTVKEFEDDQDGSAIEKIDKWLEENGYSQEQRSEAAQGVYGTYLTDKNGNKVLVLNKSFSQEGGAGVNVAAHEFLHDMMQTTFAATDADGNILRDRDGNIQIDKKKAIAIGGSLFEWVKQQKGEDFIDSEMYNRLATYGDKPSSQQFQEVMTLLSDAVVSGDMTFSEGPMTKLGDIFRRQLQKIGMPVKFNTGKDVFNFVKDYNKSIKEGNLTQAQRDVLDKGAKIGGKMQKLIDSDGVREIALEESIEERRNLLAQNGVDPDSPAGKALLASKPSNLSGLLDEFDGNKRNMINKTVGETKDGKSVFDLKNPDGSYVDNPFVRSRFGQEVAPIVETITKRLFDPIPQNLRKGITRGRFMNELTSIAAGLVEREYDATKQDLDKFVSNRLNLRANRLASDLGIESTVDEGGLGGAVSLDQAAELTAEETGPVNENTPGMVLLNRIATPEQISKIQKKVRSLIKGDQIEIDGKLKNISDLNYKTLKNLVAPEIAEVFGIKSIENYTSPTKTLKNDDVIRARLFIGKNAESIYNALPLGVTASGTATGLKQVIAKNFYTKSDKRVKFDKKEGGAGLFPQIKNKISPAEFAEAFGVVKGELSQVKGQNPATLISGLMDEVGKAVTNQTVRQELDKMNTAQDKDVAARIVLLGDGKSDAMFSQAALSKLDPSDHIGFLDKMAKINGTDIKVSDGNIELALKTKFADDIENGTYDLPRQTTEQLIEKVATTLQPIHDRMTRGKTIPPSYSFDGNTIADLIVKQYTSDVTNDKASYESIVGEKVDGLTTVSGEQSARAAAKKLAKKFPKKFVAKYIVPGLSINSRTGTGVRVYKDGSVTEFEINPNPPSKKTNRFSFGKTNDIRTLVGVVGTDYDSPASQTSKPPQKGKGLPSQETMSRVVKDGQDHNQAMRQVVEEIKNMYQNKELSKSDVVALLQAFNSNPKGLTRMAAVLDFIPTGKDANYKGEYRLEHMTPALQVNLNALNYIINPSQENLTNFNDMMDGYKVAYLPIKFDNMVNKLYKSTLPVYADAKTPSIVRYYNPELGEFDLEMKQLSTGEVIGSNFVFDKKQQARVRKSNAKAVSYKGSLYFSKASDSNAETNRKNSIVDKAIEASRVVKEPRGITVLDFDDTLATTKSRIRYTKPDGTKGSLNAEEYARDYVELSEQGYKWDFSEFNEVVDGKTAPLFNKAMKLAGKYGTKDMFVLTARPQAAAGPIQAFLKAHGLDLPIENITGLGNSTSEAKALWIADKVGEGYNDFYFADDALQNVQAVKNMLDQFDVKSKVQQAKLTMFSKASDTFNKMIENKTGVSRFATFSDAKARKRGANKGRFKFFIPPSADDFKGLLYSFLGKGKQGEQDMKFFKETLIDPFARADREVSRLRQRLGNDYKALIKSFPEARKLLTKNIPSGDFTYDTAVRTYIWAKNGVEIDGLSKSDQRALIKAVESNPELLALAQGLESITKGYPEPTDHWMSDDISSDLNSLAETRRSDLLDEFKQNRAEIFGEWKGGKLVGPNMNKIEAIYGTRFREALEDMLWRMENGTNRSFGNNRLTNRFANWVNNSVGAIMFFNMRSAALQTLSAVNFVNWSDNNPLKAAAAFANQKQYWKDFLTLFNSDMLKQRRQGLRTSVSHNELAQAAANSANPAKAVFQKLLRLGFTPTQIADSFAIASGGATFYRNRVKSLMKQGMSEADAEKQAFNDFQQIAEETQQSSRPDLISQQQASPLGRLILAFQNTPMQYTRLMKKAALDLVNGRGDAKTHISKIIYYGAVQNMIFSALQKAMFKFMFDDDEEEDKEQQKKKELSLLNGMADSILRGSGVAGAVVSTLKNMIIRFREEDAKKGNADYDKIVIDFLNLSPPVGSKARKLKSALDTYKYNKDEIQYMPKNTLDNPIWETIGGVVSSLTNVPLDRVVNKISNIREAANSDNEAWQRIALMMGWNTWDVGVETTGVEEARKEMKMVKDVQKIEGVTEEKAKEIVKDKEKLKVVQQKIELFDLNKKQQVDKLKDLGLTSKEIKALKLESDRVSKIIELTNNQ